MIMAPLQPPPPLKDVINLPVLLFSFISGLRGVFNPTSPGSGKTLMDAFYLVFVFLHPHHFLSAS